MPDITVWPEKGSRDKKLVVQYRTRGRTYIRIVGPAEYLSSTEASSYLKVSLRWLYHLVEQRILRPKREGGHLWFRLRDLQAFDAERRRRRAQRGPGGRFFD